MKTFLFPLIGFLLFLSLVFLIQFIVFRNLYFHFFKHYNIYALISTFVLIFSTLLLMVISNSFSFFFLLILKRIFYNLIGAFFIYFFVFIFLEILRYFNYDNKIVFMIFIFIGALIIGYSVSNAFTYKVTNISLSSDKIDKEYKFVVLSDIHLGSNSPKILEDITNILQDKNLDFILIPGDFIDDNYVLKEDLSSLKKLKIPKYYSFGNHEEYLDEYTINKLSLDNNLTLLRNQKSLFKNSITIVGLDDNRNITEGLKDVKLSNSSYNILMYHQPKQTIEAQKKGFDLVVSGHTHNGQIFPFNFLVRLQFDKLSGIHKQNNLIHYVSQGAGTWGPKMRLGTNNEIVIFNLKPQN